MKNKRYKDQNDKNYYLRIVVLLVLIFIFFLLNQLLNLIQNQSDIDIDSITTIKQVIEYYDSKYISEKKSKVEDFSLDVYVKFKVPLYSENKVSNEEYYTTLIEHCARVIYYKSFRLIDKENDITIEVICQNNKIISIIINGIEDYFIYMDSLIDMENYKEITEIDISIESEILQNCINNNWKSNSIDFGTRESIFDGYYIYQDEGIKVRNISEKIFNIVFTENYNQNVAGGFFPGIDIETIKSKLGKPHFEDTELKIIGYKTKDFYIFFYKNEISIYRNKDEETKDFFELADDLIYGKKDFLEFMNELTYIWPDYSEYKYTTDSVYICYPLKGIEISVNTSDINGILVYNNIRASMPVINRYLENTYFVAKLQLDLVFKSEKNRINTENGLLEKCIEYQNSLNEEELKIIGSSIKYDIYPLLDENGYIFSMRFIAKTSDMPNRELNDGIYTFTWLGDYFIFSKQNRGIYAYNINTGYVSTLITGNKDSFKIKGTENNILKYDDKEISIQF